MSEKERMTVVISASVHAGVARSKTLDMTGYKGLLLWVNVTARDGSTTLTPKITALCEGTALTMDVWAAAAAINSASTTVCYAFYPGITNTSPVVYTAGASMVLPSLITVTITPGDTDHVTYSAYAELLP
jgi:hypothetical protein